MQQPLFQYVWIVNKHEQRKLFNNPKQVNIIKLVFQKIIYETLKETKKKSRFTEIKHQFNN